MNITYTKTAELTTKQAILEANEYLASKGISCKFEIVKAHSNQIFIFVMVKRTWVNNDDTHLQYHTVITDDRAEFEKCLAGFLAKVYSDEQE